MKSFDRSLLLDWLFFLNWKSRNFLQTIFFQMVISQKGKFTLPFMEKILQNVAELVSLSVTVWCNRNIRILLNFKKNWKSHTSLNIA